VCETLFYVLPNPAGDCVFRNRLRDIIPGDCPSIKNNKPDNTMNKPNKLKGGFTLVELLVVIVIIAALAGLAVPQVMRMTKRADLTEATSNAKQLGLALLQFDADVGGFPDDETPDVIERITGEESTRTLTGSSNAYFRQMFEAYIVESEQPFYMKSAFSPRKPDDAFQGDRCLEPGEVGFGYILRTDNTAIPSGGSRPIAAGPLSKDEADSFDIEPFDGRAVVLFGDNSAQQLNIRRSDNQAVLTSGETLLSTGDNSPWGTITPQLVSPE